VGPDGETALRPELEFVFRTLVNLRMDVDDLRRDFERYRENQLGGTEIHPGSEGVFPDDARLKEVFPEPPITLDSGVVGEPGPTAGQDSPSAEGVVVYRPGMTMEDVEEEAIRTVLAEVGGNRRKAAERLGIGERTLYRKIKKFGLDESSSSSAP
jgi:transcriptional regulator of acetoin/glycerol metabolism